MVVEAARIDKQRSFFARFEFTYKCLRISDESLPSSFLDLSYCRNLGDYPSTEDTDENLISNSSSPPPEKDETSENSNIDLRLEEQKEGGDLENPHSSKVV